MSRSSLTRPFRVMALLMALTLLLVLAAPASAAIDAGVDAGVTADIDGQPRPMGAGYDIGADEHGAVLYLPLMLRGS